MRNLKKVVLFSAIVFLLFGCKKEVHKDYKEISSAVVNGYIWNGDADAIHKSNILGEKVWVKSFSFLNAADTSTIKIEFFEAQSSISEGSSWSTGDAKFSYSHNYEIFTTDFNYPGRLGKLTITEYDEGYGMEGTFEFTAFKSDSTKVIVTGGIFSAKDY